MDACLRRARASSLAALIVLSVFALFASFAHAANVQYIYDEVGRLKQVIWEDGTVTTYQLDAPGNRTSVVTALPPSPPGSPQITNITGSTATATWTASNAPGGLSGYEYRLNSAPTWTNLNNVLTVPLTGLAEATQYTFEVRAYDVAGVRGNPASATFTTLDVTAPSSPGTLTVEVLSSTSARVSWPGATDNVGVTGYEYRLNNAPSWTPIANVLNVTLTGLTPLTNPPFEIRARDAAGNRGPASSKTIDMTPPNPPGVPAFSSVTWNSATVTWTAASDNVAVTRYRYSLNGGSSWTNLGVVLSVNLTGLSGSTPYTVHVQAGDAAGNWSTSSSASFLTPPQPDVATMPTSFMVVGGGLAIQAGYWPELGPTNPPTLPSGKTIAGWVDVSAATSVSMLTLSGFTSDPGQSWLITATVELMSKSGASATSYSYSGGSATWQWNSAFGFWTGGNTTVNVTIIHGHQLTPPSSPGTPTFSSITGTTATATWAAASAMGGIGGYEYRLNNAGTWTNVGNVLSVNLSGLTQATSYSFQVRAYDLAGNRGNASSNNFSTPDQTPPSAPGTPVMSNITSTSATATWPAASDNVAVTGYEYRLNGAATWTNVGNVVSVNITGLTQNTTYTVDVRAYDAAGNRGNAASTSFGSSDGTPPSAPGTPTFSSITGSSVTATWPAATDNIAVAGYEWRFNGTGNWNAVGNVVSVNITGLSQATTYTFQVRAYDGAGNRGNIAQNNFTTPDVTPPNPPGTPSISSITASSATASWPAASDNVGVTGYEYRLNGAPTWTNVGNVTSVGLGGLSQASTYAFEVRAYDAAGLRSSASLVNFNTPDVSPPSAPGTPSFSSITHSTATASWGAAGDNVGVAGYRYSLNGGASWTYVGNVLSTGLSGLSGSTSYTMHVQAHDAAGNWGAASAGSFTTAVAPDVAVMPTSFMIVAGGFAIQAGYWPELGPTSPSTLPSGKVITGWYDVSATTSISTLTVAGFSGDPGKTWLTNAIAGSISKTGASATSYSYFGGTATWQWNTAFGFWTGGNTTVSVQLVHP